MKPFITAPLPKQLADQAFQRYVDWRRGNRAEEKRCYKTTDTILLTFDDYASAEQAGAIIGLLKQHQVRAMIFAQGNWAIESAGVLEQFRAAGHIIGNHTFTHADLRFLSDEAIVRELSQGPHEQPWFRPPYGSYDRRVRNLAHQLGYVICYWSIDSHDWTGQATPQSILDRVLSRLHPGAVILLHAHVDATIAALPQLIAGIQARGFRLDSLNDPLWRPPASLPQPLRPRQTPDDE